MANLVKYPLAVALMLLAALAVAARTRNAAATKLSTDAEFKVLIDRYYREWSTLNPDNAAPLYAKDADLIFFDLALLQYHGWDEYKEGVKKTYFDKMSGGKVTPNDDLKVVRRANIAWT